MRPVSANDALAMVRNLDTFLEDVSAYLQQFGAGPGPAAQALAEIAVFPRAESVRTAGGQGAVLVDVAADHIVSFIRSVTEPVLTIAPWSCVRAVLEASAIAAWLLD